jgi:hypothetical protein
VQSQKSIDMQPHYRIYFGFTIFFIFFGFSLVGPLKAHFTETFEDETVGSGTFIGGGVTFITTQDLDVGLFTNGGSNGPGDHQFLEAFMSGSVGEIQMQTASRVFQIHTMDVWLSSNSGNNTSAGTVTFRGTLPAGGTMDAVISISPPTSTAWVPITLVGSALDGVNLTKVEVILSMGKNYIAIDDFEFTQLDPNVVNVTINDLSIAEGNTGNTPFQFTITRTYKQEHFYFNGAVSQWQRYWRTGLYGIAGDTGQFYDGWWSDTNCYGQSEWRFRSRR